MIRLLRTRSGVLAMGAHTTTQPGALEAAVDVALDLYGVGTFILVAGWGYDTDMPLRPWPQWRWRAKTPKGNTIASASMGGFFVTLHTPFA